MSKFKVGIAVGLIVVLGAGAYFYYKPKPAVDPELAQIQKEVKNAMGDDYQKLKEEYESSSNDQKLSPAINKEAGQAATQVSSNSISEAPKYVPSKDKFYRTPEGVFVTDLFNELIKGVSYKKLGSTDDFTYSNKLLDAYFDRNSPKHPAGKDDRWLYAKGVDNLAKTFLSQGPAELIGHPLLHEFQNVDNGNILKGTALIHTVSSDKYQGVRYYMLLTKKANGFVASETDFNVELIDIPATELNRYIDIFEQG